MPNLTSIATWAKSVGISRQQGYEAVKRCGIPVIDGDVDPEYATYLYDKLTRKRANGNRAEPLAGAAVPAAAAGVEGSTPPAKVPGYDTSRARREAAEAETSEIKLAELAGKFLLKTEVDSCLFEIARSLRDGLNNCARRIAADVASLNTVEACETAIEREHGALLATVAHSLMSDLGIDITQEPAS